MLTIRLSRIGKKNKPMYRLIISEKARDPYGKALEILGSYNPASKVLDVKKDRVEHWLKQGSGMSATVNNLLVKQNVIKGEVVRATKIKLSKQKEIAAKKIEANKKTKEPVTEEKIEANVTK
jgi:small subunit ribosomal protein S16